MQLEPAVDTAPDSACTHQVLASRGVGGYRQYRIPALAVATSGTVLAAYDGRPNLDDLPNTIDLLLRRSFDHGLTWEPQQVIRTGSGLHGFGDPSLIVDQKTSRIFCFHAAGTHAGFFEAIQGLEPVDQVQHVDLSFSDDEGTTWTHSRITDQLKRPGITGIFAAAGAGIQLRHGRYAGRLIQQMVALDEGTIRAGSAYSDDHGETWTLGELSDSEANENKSVELPDGRVLMHSRGPGTRYRCVSHDGGHSYTALEPIADLPDPSDNGSLFSLSPGEETTLLVTNNHDSALRRNTVLSRSTDLGAHWEPTYTICAGSSAYSTGAILADGSLGVLYERDGYSEIVFAHLPAGALNDAALTRAADEYLDDDGGDFTMVLRSITPARPEHWISVGEEHVISASAGDWGNHAWKEIGQGYHDSVQVLGSREAQDANYGPVAPGLRAGDILAFTGRFRNPTDRPLSVALAGNYDQAQSPQFGNEPVAAGEQRLFCTPSYTLSAQDALSPSFAVNFVVTSADRQWIQRFTVEPQTGRVVATEPQ